uniref:Uncharacterized protein n=1 Tax=Oryza sativa subsp. japonica TaxID=39947 RepID=Q6ER86_ORYSJ|nr:hypothetical protein [Oryza sativa Japonica Group]BAD28834.1 hypothetical protein [Oryza sativa Japonica Group]
MGSGWRCVGGCGVGARGRAVGGSTRRRARLGGRGEDGKDGRGERCWDGREECGGDGRALRWPAVAVEAESPRRLVVAAEVDRTVGDGGGGGQGGRLRRRGSPGQREEEGKERYDSTWRKEVVGKYVAGGRQGRHRNDRMDRARRL